jgi:hypothetical protein
MLNKLKHLALKLWSNDNVRRIFHTFWQSFVAVLLASVVTVHDWHTLWAVLAAAVAAGFSAVKNALVARWRRKREKA